MATRSWAMAAALVAVAWSDVAAADEPEGPPDAAPQIVD